MNEQELTALRELDAQCHGKPYRDYGGCEKYFSAQDHVHSLALEGCGLTQFPEMIQHFPHLHWLSMADNMLTDLPDFLFDLTQLLHLDVSGNQLTSFSYPLSRLRDLQALHLSHNLITTVQGISSHPALCELSIDHNPLGEEVADIRDLPALTDLNIAGLQLTFLPFFHGAFPLLTTLNAAGNHLTNFQGLDDLSLTRLSLAENGLLTIPDSLFDMDSLEQLSFADNRLREVPPDIAKLTRLKYLDLSGNPFPQNPVTEPLLARLEKVALARCLLPLSDQFMLKKYHALDELEEVWWTPRMSHPEKVFFPESQQQIP